MSSSRNKSRKEREPQPSQGPSSSWQMPPGMPPGMVPPPWGAMWPYSPPFGASPMLNNSEGKAVEKAAKRPWSSSSSDDEDDDDFQRPKSKKKSGPQQQPKKTGGKRGRPTKQEVAARAAAAASTSATQPAAAPSDPAGSSDGMDIVSRYPAVFKDRVPVAFNGKDECLNCNIYVGNVALVPCGHYKFCHDCLNKLRATALKMKRPAKCLNRDCYELVKSWVHMYHVHV